MARTKTKTKQTPKPEPVARGWSRTSIRQMATCHSDIVRVLEAALPTAPMDFKVIKGHRGRDEQNLAYRQGKSRLKYPASKHNKFPSRAVDIIPLPLNWDDLDSFTALAEHILAVAEELGVEMRWGGDWDRDGEYYEPGTLIDGPHFELI